MIAGEDEAAAREREDEMIAGMAGGGDGLHLPAFAADQCPVRQGHIRHEIPVDAGVHFRRTGRRPLAAPEAVARRPGRRGQALDVAGMVAVGMGDQYVGDRLAGRGRHQRVEMGFVVRAGIDDGHPAAADDVAVGAGKGEGAGVRRRDPAHARRHRHCLPVSGVEIATEDEISHRR